MVMKTGPLDADLLQSLQTLMEDGFADVVEVYVSDSAERISQMHTQGTDAHSLMALAHSLKGSSGNMGALVLSDLCKDLEMDARAGELHLAGEKIAAIEAEFNQVKAALQAAAQQP